MKPNFQLLTIALMLLALTFLTSCDMGGMIDFGVIKIPVILVWAVVLGVMYYITFGRKK